MGVDRQASRHTGCGGVGEVRRTRPSARRPPPLIEVAVLLGHSAAPNALINLDVQRSASRTAHTFNGLVCHPNPTFRADGDELFHRHGKPPQTAALS